MLVSIAIYSNVSYAQSIGDKDSTKRSITFTADLNGVSLDPSPAVGTSTRRKITKTYDTYGSPDNFGWDLGTKLVVAVLDEYAGISVPSEVLNFANGVGDFSNVSVTPKFDLGGEVKFGGYFELNSIGNADIDVDYPVEVVITFPDSNTFGCGYEIEILTEYRILPKANKLKVDPPFYEMEVGPVLEDLKVKAEFGLSFSACIGLQIPKVGCGGYHKSWSNGFTLLDKSIPLPSFLDPLPPLARACENAFGNNKTVADLVACSQSNSVKPFINLMESAVKAYGNSQNPPRTYTIASFSDRKISFYTPDLPFGAPPLPEMEGSFINIGKGDLTYQSLNGGRKLKVSGGVNDVTKMQLDLISLLEFADIPTGFSAGGNLGSIDIGDISPTFSVNQTMDFEYEPVIHLNIDLGTSMQWEVVDPVLGSVNSGTGQIVPLLAGQKIVVQFPDALSDPVTVTPTTSMDGDFTTLTKQRYYTSFDINFIQVAISDWKKTLYHDNIGKEELTNSPLVIQDHTFNLTGIPSIQLDKFLLNPENPIIDVDYLGVEDVANIGGGERVVVYKINISNGGDVKLSDVKLNFDLAEAYQDAASMTVLCTGSDHLTPNTNFDGDNDINILASGNTLEVGESKSIEVVVKIKPEISDIDANGCFETVDYSIYTQAFGTSPIGTKIQSNVYQCTDTRTADDIVTSVDLGASVINELSDYSIYGWTWVKFDKSFDRSEGNIGSSDKIIFENVSQKSAPEVEIVGDLHAGNQVFVQGESKVIVDYIQVTHDVKIPNKKSYVHQTGAISENSSCVATMSKPTWSTPSFTGKKKIKIGDNDSVALAPGSYGEVWMNENSVVEFSAGTYNIGKWVFMDDNAKAWFDTRNGAVVVNLGTWQPLQREGLSLSLKDADSSVKDIHLNYYGNQVCKFKNSFVQGIITAPYTVVEFGDYTRFEGSCYADKVEFGYMASFSGPEYLEPLKVHSNCSDVLDNVGTANTEMFTDHSSDGNGVNSGLPYGLDNAQANGSPIDGNWNVKLYPNPFESVITVVSDASISHLKIYNSVGQVIVDIDPDYNYLEIDLAQYARGIYTVAIEIQGEVRTVKVVKSR